jgi:GNAT superfamily N-acetyltransferase
MASLVFTEGCGGCQGFPGVLHANNCPHRSGYVAPTAESIKKAAEKATKEAEAFAAKKATIDIKTLTYDITDEDQGGDGGSYDKIIKVQIIDGDEVIGEWSIYFYFSSGTPSVRGEVKRFYHTAHLGHKILIDDAYQGQGLSRFMGKKLADKITNMINNNKLREDDLFWITSDATGGFWQSIGMTTVEERPLPHPHFDWTPTIEDDCKWMYVGEFCNWANGAKEGTKPESIKRLTYLMDVIELHPKGKKISNSLFGGGRKKRTRKKIKRKRRKTRRKSKKKRKTRRKSKKKRKTRRKSKKGRTKRRK